MKDLFQKYDVPAPRYTSYPTVPYWENAPTSSQWLENLAQSLAPQDAAWSMYLHVPYCESLCTFCGCNTVITKDHGKEKPYVETILKEWSLYLSQISVLSKRPLQHLHLGGGTPTFLSADHLHQLLSPILAQVSIGEDFEGSIEVDPRRTTRDQLEVLKKLGFRRVSLGVQDFNPEVQRLINRIQPFEITKNITVMARELGYDSVNFDLIYGLAKQTTASIQESVERTIELRPDRIALYSLALVPWIKPAQRLFKDEDLPAGEDKRKLYEIARSLLLAAGYVEIGMDHFALPTDSLAIASQADGLHRNFMGYTNQKSEVLLGLGVSAISETPQMFHQNEKLLPTYQQKVESNEIASFRGHCLTPEDQIRRKQILEFMTKGRVRFQAGQRQAAELFLAEMKNDGLIEIFDSEMILTDKGRPFLRNACIFFDERLKNKSPTVPIFSKTL
ncbi:MAG: oxygen-independent coproporphyrinogen III oxidase [Pseudobdellovibrionaceae bacterium]